MPFHAVLNYDGQLTGQNGIHARFESLLFERYRTQLTIAPKPMAPIRNPRDFIFDTMLAGTQLVPPILKSDLEAIGTRDVYDDAYYEAFFTANRAVLERRLNESIAAVAAMITGAWEAAGKPAAAARPARAPAAPPALTPPDPPGVAKLGHALAHDLPFVLSGGSQTMLWTLSSCCFSSGCSASPSTSPAASFTCCSSSPWSCSWST